MTGANGADRLRVDKWLWYARFYKSRSLATRMVSTGRLRVNKKIVAKPHYQVKAGDVLTFARGPHIRVIEILGIGTRRGPASEAATLYADLSPPQRQPKKEVVPAQRDKGAGRPTKRDRRAIDRLLDVLLPWRGNPRDGEG